MSNETFSAGTWRRVALGVKDQNTRDRLGIVSAGVAFYAFLAIFPALVALVSVYGLVANPDEVQRIVAQLHGVMPEGAASIIGSQLDKVARGASTSLGWGVVVGIVAALWSANSGTKALISAVELAYDQQEQRGFLRLNGISLLLTAGATVGVLLALAVIAVLPVGLKMLPLSGLWSSVLSWLRWPFIAAIVAGGLALFYRFAPSQPVTDWRLLWSGAAVATVLWLIISALFSWYAASFGSYNKTYGSLAAVVVLLMWFFLSVYAVLIGAEVNSVLRRERSPRARDG